MPKYNTGTMNHSFANKNLKETSGCELVMELMKIHIKKTPTENKMGSFQRFLGMKGRCNWSADNQSMRPNNKGSLGMNNPKLELNSSMLMDKGVRNATAINNFSV